MDNQNKIGMFLVAIVAVVAVVGIVLQFAGSSSADLDFSATGEAVYTKEATSKLSKSSIVNEMKNSATKSNAGRIDTDSESEATAAGGVYGVGSESDSSDALVGGIETDPEELERKKQACATCSGHVTNDYFQCMDDSITEHINCNHAASGPGSTSDEEELAQIESALQDCTNAALSAEAKCNIDFYEGAADCKREYSLLPDFICTVPTDVIG